MPDDTELALDLIAGYLSPKTKPSKKEGQAAFHRIVLEACEFLREEGLGHIYVVLDGLAQAANPDRPRVEFKGATQGAKSAHAVLYRDFLIAREVHLYNRANGRGGVAFVAKRLKTSDDTISRVCRKPKIKDMLAVLIDMDRTAEAALFEVPKIKLGHVIDGFQKLLRFRQVRNHVDLPLILLR